MFGPDICGKIRRVEMSFQDKKGAQKSCNEDKFQIPKDDLTHIYTWEIDQKSKKYQLFVDMKLVQSGSLVDDWNVNVPRFIPDPNAKKPSDWVDSEYMVDPDDKKPDDWDEAMIEERVPSYWNPEVHGKFIPKKIKNPHFGQTWRARNIQNPNYKGKWTPPLIDNPDFVVDDSLFGFEDIGYIGFPLFQVKSGTIIGNLLITDSLEYANEQARIHWQTHEAEERRIREQKNVHQGKEEPKKPKTGQKRSNTGSRIIDAFLNDEPLDPQFGKVVDSSVQEKLDAILKERMFEKEAEKMSKAEKEEKLREENGEVAPTEAKGETAPSVVKEEPKQANAEQQEEIVADDAFYHEDL